MNSYGGWLAATTGLVTLLCLMSWLVSLLLRNAAHRKIACGVGLLLCLGLVSLAFSPTIGPVLPEPLVFLADARMWIHAASLRLSTGIPVQWIFSLFLVVTALLLLQLALANYRVRRLRRHSEPFPGWEHSSVPVRLCFELEGPLTVGAARPAILLPASALDWPEDWVRVVIAHERAHALSRDGIWMMGAGVATAIFWFNPFVWILSRRMAMQAEHSADDAALLEGASSTDYARILLNLATGNMPTEAASGFAEQKTLKKRFHSILYPRQRQAPNPRLQAAAILISAFFGVLLSFAAASDPRTGEAAARHSGSTTLAALGGKVLEVRRTTPNGVQVWDQDGNWMSGPRSDQNPFSTPGPLSVIASVPGFVWPHETKESSSTYTIRATLKSDQPRQATSHLGKVTMRGTRGLDALLELSIDVSPSARAFTSLQWAILAPDASAEVKTTVSNLASNTPYIWRHPAFDASDQLWALSSDAEVGWHLAVAARPVGGVLTVRPRANAWREGQTVRARPLRPMLLSLHNLPVRPARGRVLGINFW